MSFDRANQALKLDAMAHAWGVNGNEKGKTIWFELEPSSRPVGP